MTTTGRLATGQAGIAGGDAEGEPQGAERADFDRSVVTDANGNRSDGFAPAGLVPNDPNRVDVVDNF